MADNKDPVSPPLTAEARENKITNYALLQIEEQVKNKTASSQILAHYAKLATAKTNLELERMRLENKLLEEKIKSEQSSAGMEKMVEEVLNALGRYRMDNSND